MTEREDTNGRRLPNERTGYHLLNLVLSLYCHHSRKRGERRKTNSSPVAMFGNQPSP